MPPFLMTPLWLQEDIRAVEAEGAAAILSEGAGEATGDVGAGAFKLRGGCIFQTCKIALDSFWLVMFFSRVITIECAHSW